MSTGDAFTTADHVTEREPGPWRDCTFASMLEVCRDGFPDGRDIPATVAEKEALRAAAGLPDDHAGGTIAQAVDAAERRYGLAGGFRVTSDWAVVRTALYDASSRCVVQGSMGSVPAHLRRWDNFFGAHAVAARGTVWCDPLAPTGSYVGELVPMGTWESYFRGLPGGQAFITTVGGLTRMAGGDFVIYEPQVESRKRGKVRAGTPFFNDWALHDKRGAFSGAATVQVIGYRSTAYAVEVSTAQGWADGVQRNTCVYVAQAMVTLQPDVPDPTPYTQADLDAAYARGKAEADVKHAVTLSIDGAPVSTTEV